MTRLLIADSQPIFREGNKRILAVNPDMEVVDEASTGPDTLQKNRDLEVDVITLDLGIERAGFLGLLKQLRTDRPHVKILVIGAKDAAVRALRAGAAGHLPRNSAPDDLVTAIRKVDAGRKFITAALAERLAQAVIRGGAPHEALSDREYEVLQLLVAGHTVKEIAERLALSPKTVSTHRSRLLAKMDLGTNADLVQYATEHGLDATA